MAKIHDLPIGPHVRDQLLAEKLRTTEDLWRAVGTDYEAGVRKLQARTLISRDRLAHALGAAAAAPRRRLHPGEALAGAALLGLLALAGLRLAEALRISPFPVPSLTAEVSQVVVKPGGGLPAFHRLKEGDLELVARSRTAGGLTRKKDALGRHLLRPLPAGSPVRRGDLGGPALPDLTGRWIVTLPIASSALGPQVATGEGALLILSSKDPVKQTAVEAVALVLAIEKGTGPEPSGRVTLAIPPERRKEIAAALGSSEVFLARQAPAAP